MQIEVAIVTGGASGIGCTSDERLVWREATHAVADLNAAAAQAAVEEIRAGDGQASARDAAAAPIDRGAA